MKHCGGFAYVLQPDGRRTLEELHGRACRSSEGACACTCDGCVGALGCKHESTFMSMGTLTPMFPDMPIRFLPIVTSLR